MSESYGHKTNKTFTIISERGEWILICRNRRDPGIVVVDVVKSVAHWNEEASRVATNFISQIFSRFPLRFTVLKPKDDKNRSQWDESGWIFNGAMDFLLPVF